MSPRAVSAGALAAAVLVLAGAGACRDDDAPTTAPPPAATAAPVVPVAESVVYTCQMRVLDRRTTPYGEAEAWAPERAVAEARAIPEACRRAGGGAECGAEEDGWSTKADCAAVTHEGHPGWSCVARAAQGGVAEATAEASTTMDAACNAALAAACDFVHGGEDCLALRGDWQLVERVRGKRVDTGAAAVPGAALP